MLDISATPPNLQPILYISANAASVAVQGRLVDGHVAYLICAGDQSSPRRSIYLYVGYRSRAQSKATKSDTQNLLVHMLHLFFCFVLLVICFHFCLENLFSSQEEGHQSLSVSIHTFCLPLFPNVFFFPVSVDAKMVLFFSPES